MSRGDNRLTGRDCGYCQRPTRTGPLGGPDFDTEYTDEDGDDRDCCFSCMTHMGCIRTLRAQLATAKETAFALQYNLDTVLEGNESLRAQLATAEVDSARAALEELRKRQCQGCHHELAYDHGQHSNRERCDSIEIRLLLERMATPTPEPTLVKVECPKCHGPMGPCGKCAGMGFILVPKSDAEKL